MAVEVHDCGTPIDPPDTMRSVSELDVTGLIELFEGELDQLTCKGISDTVGPRRKPAPLTVWAGATGQSILLRKPRLQQTDRLCRFRLMAQWMSTISQVSTSLKSLVTSCPEDIFCAQVLLSFD